MFRWVLFGISLHTFWDVGFYSEKKKISLSDFHIYQNFAQFKWCGIVLSIWNAYSKYVITYNWYFHIVSLP